MLLEFHSIIPVDVVRVKSYVNLLFDHACVPLRIMINKIYFLPKRVVSGVASMTVPHSQGIL